MTDNTARKIASISTLDELDAYEAEARRRGLLPGEMMALTSRRNELTKSTARSVRHG